MLFLNYEASSKDLLGTPIRRVLPTAKKRMMGHFIFLDHMGPVRFPADKSSSLTSHPHIGLATLTYLFEGQLHHRDSLGTSQIIKPGDVNWMIAGRGISHSEHGVQEESSDNSLHGLQFWMALPDEEEDSPAQFHHLKKEVIPETNSGGFKITEIVGLASPVPASKESTLLVLESKAAANWNSNIKNQELAVYIIEGSVAINGQMFKKNHVALYSPDSSIQIETLEKSLLVVFGGRAYQGISGQKEKHIFWNFVSSSKEKIRNAVLNWNSGNFPMVPGATERILSPEFKR
ncbi:MAG: pirin family protein [Bdellovibrionales bacterium]